jgi:hypothetical protein
MRMCNSETIFEKYTRAVCRDIRAEKLRRALEAHCRDGSELYSVVDRALPGLENAAAAAVIKAAIKSAYANSISLDAVTDVVARAVELTWAPADKSQSTRERESAPDAVLRQRAEEPF